MNNEIQQFYFNGAALRTLTDKTGEPWFVAKDVCDILEISNVTMALQKLDDDERSKFNLGRQGETNIVNEAGLFRIKETAVTHSDGHVTISRTPKVTGKGQRYFIARYCPKKKPND